MNTEKTITAEDLTSRATARARRLIDTTVSLAGMDLTERERDIVVLGINLGVAGAIAEIRTASIEQSTD